MPMKQNRLLMKSRKVIIKPHFPATSQAIIN